MARMLRELADALGRDLQPVHPVPAPRAPISAVHISELDDPTPFLNGGELLMTTGMNMTADAHWCSAYVHRLVRTGVVGLVLGLGPIHASVPDSLRAAAMRAQLPLLVVPPDAAFLTVTREFWTGELNRERRAFRTTASAHRALVTAATSKRPLTAVLDTLARAISGWAARLSPSGELVAVCPAARRDSAAALTSEVTRQRTAGVHAAATFPLGDDDVILYPLSDRHHTVGYLAAAAPRPVREPVRQLARTSAALLNVTWARECDVRRAARQSAVALITLLRRGDVDAALAVAPAIGICLPQRRLRVAVAAADDDTDVDRLWDMLADTTAPIASAPADERVVLLFGAEPNAVERLKVAAADMAHVRVAIGAPVPPDGVPNTIATTLRAVDEVAPDTVEDFADLAGPLLPRLSSPALQRWAEARVAALVDYPRIDLVPTIVEYLRHRRSAEAAARAQNLHRHTLKYRIARANDLLHCDLDTPDAAAEIWLALRLRGLT